MRILDQKECAARKRLDGSEDLSFFFFLWDEGLECTLRHTHRASLQNELNAVAEFTVAVGSSSSSASCPSFSSPPSTALVIGSGPHDDMIRCHRNEMRHRELKLDPRDPFTGLLVTENLEAWRFYVRQSDIRVYVDSPVRRSSSMHTVGHNLVLLKN